MLKQCLHALKKSDSLESYLAYVNGLQTLNEEQEIALIVDYQENNNLDAAHQVILSHMRLVTHIARKYIGYGLPIEDLIQEGTIGLIKSVKKFKLDFGVRLSSYAIYYIRAEIQEFALLNWRSVKAATTKKKRKLFFNLRRFKTEIRWLNNAERKNIANELDASEKDIDDIEIQLSNSDVPLDAPIDSYGNGTVSSIGNLEDKSEAFPDKIIEEDFKKKLMSKIRKIINSLDERSKDIIVNRWLSKEKYSHKLLSKQYRVSAERIRQIEKNALLKIRKNITLNDLVS